MPSKHDTLASALAAAQGELRDPERNKVGQVRGKRDYRYAGLDDILQTVRPVLSKHGIALTQVLCRDKLGLVLRTELIHQDRGLRSDYPLQWDGGPQDHGAELTYARRYSLEAILGIAATDDADGPAKTTPPAAPPKQQAADHNKVPTDEIRKQLGGRMKTIEASHPGVLRAAALSMGLTTLKGADIEDLRRVLSRALSDIADAKQRQTEQPPPEAPPAEPAPTPAPSTDGERARKRIKQLEKNLSESEIDATRRGCGVRIVRASTKPEHLGVLIAALEKAVDAKRMADPGRADDQLYNELEQARIERGQEAYDMACSEASIERIIDASEEQLAYALEHIAALPDADERIFE